MMHGNMNVKCIQAVCFILSR